MGRVIESTVKNHAKISSLSLKFDLVSPEFERRMIRNFQSSINDGHRFMRAEGEANSLSLALSSAR